MPLLTQPAINRQSSVSNARARFKQAGVSGSTLGSQHAGRSKAQTREMHRQQNDMFSRRHPTRISGNSLEDDRKDMIALLETIDAKLSLLIKSHEDSSLSRFVEAGVSSLFSRASEDGLGRLDSLGDHPTSHSTSHQTSHRTSHQTSHHTSHQNSGSASSSVMALSPVQPAQDLPPVWESVPPQVSGLAPIDELPGTANQSEAPPDLGTSLPGSTIGLNNKDFKELKPRTFADRSGAGNDEHAGGKMKLMDASLTGPTAPGGARGWLPLERDSSPRMFMDGLGMVMLLMDTILVPFTVAYEKGLEGPLLIVAWVTVLFWTTDIVANFVTTYTQHDVEVKAFRRIAKNYMKTWLTVDLIVVGVDWFALILQGLADDSNTGTESGARQYVKIVRLLKGFRLVRVLAVLRSGRFAQVQDLAFRQATLLGINLQLKFAMGITKLVFLILWLNHMGSCLWWIFVRNVDRDANSWHMTIAEELGVDQLVSNSEWDMYIYFSGFYWSATAMFSGASFRPPSNSAEALFALAYIILGMLFGSTLISSVAAMLVDFQVVTRDQTEKLSTLRKYLRQNGVPSVLSISVQAQIVERITAEKRLSAADVSVLSMLSSNLRTQLLYEINFPRLGTDPVLKLCDGVDDLLLKDICSSRAIQAETVDPGLIVFQPKEPLGTAFYIISGCVQYNPENKLDEFITRSRRMDAEMDQAASHSLGSYYWVTEKEWLADLALWTHWTSMGLAECVKHGELLLVLADDLGDVLRKHASVAEVIEDYARALVAAIMGEQLPVNDLSSKHVGIDHIICALPLESRLKLSLPALQSVKEKFANNSRKSKALNELEKEVREGKCYLTSNHQGIVLRVVNVVALRICRRDKFLAEVGKWVREEGVVKQTKAKIPGTKTRAGELPAAALQRLISSEVSAFRAVISVESAGVVEISEAASDSFGLTTRYVRTKFEADVTEEQMEEVMEKLCGLHSCMVGGYLRVVTTASAEDLATGDFGARVSEASNKSGSLRTTGLARHSWRSERSQWDARRPLFTALRLVVGSVESVSDASVPLYAWVTDQEFDQLNAGELGVFEVLSEV